MTTENIIENSEEMEEDNDDKTKELDQQLMVQFTSETGNLYPKLSKYLFCFVSLLSKLCHVNEFNNLIL